jgi:hypothetical protein
LTESGKELYEPYGIYGFDMKRIINSRNDKLWFKIPIWKNWRLGIGSLQGDNILLRIYLYIIQKVEDYERLVTIKYLNILFKEGE